MSSWKSLTVTNFKDDRMKKRGKYGTPCDNCKKCKVKCEPNIPCGRCKRKCLPCTFNRTKIRKVGPKGPCQAPNNLMIIPPTTKSRTLGNASEIIGKERLLPFLYIYQRWYYGNWPILPVKELIKSLNDINPTSETPATMENILCYSLSLSLAAAIANQLTFLSNPNPIDFDIANINPSHFIDESNRVRNLINYKSLPNIENVLISFFNYIYYVNIKNGMSCGLMYMKESIDFIQLLRIHDPNIYKSKSNYEIHILSKFYYMLLISERYMSIEQNVPICLDYSIPLPNLDYDENSKVLLGFLELVKSFAAPNRQFFEILMNYYSNKAHIRNKKNDWKPNDDWIRRINETLHHIKIQYASGETQSMNVILSKHWMRSLIWNMSFQSNLLMQDLPEDDCLSYNHSVKIAKDFLHDTNHLSVFAFESNGPGLCVKLLEIANGVTDSINYSKDLTNLPILTKLFDLVSKYKSDITIPSSIYLKVKDSIIRNSNLPEDHEKSDIDYDVLNDFTINSLTNSPLVELNYFNMDLKN